MKAVRLRVPVGAVAMMLATASVATSQTSVVVDQYMTPTSGSSDLIAVQSAIVTPEDRIFPAKLGDEQTRLSLAAGILYRAAKFSGFDLPQDHMLLVVNHEVFGHGARIRELGNGRIGYSFDAPLPYGDGGAVTSFSGEFPDTPLAMLAVESAGIEAQNTMADLLERRSIARGRLHYREAWLYFENRYLGMTYILSATPFSEEGHDVADFLQTFKSACLEPECTPPTSRAIKRGARFTLADPFLYFALYGFAGSYVGQGRTTSAIPMIPLGRRIRYLPSLGFQLAPYGTEHLLRNIFTVGDAADARAQLLSVTARVGHTGASTPWAVELLDSRVRLVRQFHAEVTAAVWKQPPPDSDTTSAPLQFGGAVAATFEVPLTRLLRSPWLKGTVTAGYKSAGFLPGERLGSGAVIRVGVMAGRSSR
jgi:hypothetical protein